MAQHSALRTQNLPVLFVVGPTASGKEAVSLRLAELLGGEIVSLDSMKVYRGMDIGTAKPSLAQRAKIRHHLVDVVDPWEPFSAARYAQLAACAVTEIRLRGKVPIVSGGTPLYLKAMVSGFFEGPGADWSLRRELAARAGAEGVESLHRELSGVDPEAARRIHPRDERRIVRALEVAKLTGRPISALQTQWSASARESSAERFILFGIRRDKEDLHHRINRRSERMFDGGLVEEVARLAAAPSGIGRAAAQAVGYKEVLKFLRGEVTREEALVEIKKRTRHFAKHQMTWFRRFPEIHWVSCAPEAEPGALAEAMAARFQEMPR